MDYNDLWEVTIVPSVTSSNDTIAPSTRTLSTISERESKRDFCLPFDGNKRKKEDSYRKAEISKITSLSPTYQKLNHDYSHRSFKPAEQLITVLRGNEKELHDRMKDRMNKEDTHSQICKDMNNASDAPFIELGAVYKIIDLITDSDPKVASLTNNCCNEISRTLQSLLARRHDKKLEDLLLNDSSLYRCERCGVISYMIGSRPAIEKIKRDRTKIRHDDETVTAKHNCVNNNQNNKKSEILINSSNLRNKSQSRINNFKVNNKAKYKDELSEMESLPTKERAFVMKRSIESLNKANNISSTEASINATIKNKFYFNNAIKKLFPDLGTGKRNKRYEYNSAAQYNPSKHESSNAIKAYTGIDKEEVVREILYESQSQIDDLLARDRCSNNAQKIPASERLFDKHSDIYPVIDTVKYLARGQFTELDMKEEEFLSKLQERRFTRLEDAKNERSSVLYGSRDDYSQRDTGFWLFDESGRLLALDEYRYLPTSGIDNNRENVSFPANVSQYSRTIEKIKTNSWSNYMDKDSLEDCALLKQRRKSDATVFSSSSVENLIHELIGSVDRKYEIIKTDNKDIPRGRKLVSSRPSLDIARHVRTQIAADRHSGNAKKSIGEICTHDSNVLARLSSETRRKICHLIKAIVSSDKDSTSFHEKYLTNILNGKKLLRSKSVDAAFARCYKIDNEITNICADDRISTKLSELPENKNHLPRKQDDFVNTCSPNLNKSKNSVKILHENTITPVSSDKSADNSTKKIVRQIVYKDVSLKNVVDNDDGHAKILPFYRKILENSGDMDWENFREFVEVLHPGEKELWRDVCRTISEETRRTVGDADGNTEICIEISPVNPEETLKTGKVMTYAREIVFELDMTLKNIENVLNKRLAEERLDTHNDVDKDVTCWSNGGRETTLKQIH